jgi:hypothetical protein
MRAEAANGRSRSRTPVQRKDGTVDGTMVSSRLKYFDSLLTSLSTLIADDDGSVHVVSGVSCLPPEVDKGVCAPQTGGSNQSIPLVVPPEKSLCPHQTPTRAHLSLPPTH